MIKKCSTCLLTLCVFLFPAFASHETYEREEEFLQGMKEIRDLMGKGKWAEAKAGILSLLEEHREQNYVLVRTNEIREDVKRCAVRIAVSQPDPKTLISGSMLFDSTTGMTTTNRISSTISIKRSTTFGFTAFPLRAITPLQ